MRRPPLLPAAATGLILAASLAVAADRRIEGTVKAVDAEKSTITITTKAGATAKEETLDVVKKAKVTVNGQAAVLKDLRRGQQAVAVFNTELEVITRLDATGEGIAPLVPEVTVVNELPEPEGFRGGPWPAADGLTLYWYSKPSRESPQFWIWSARRASREGLFEDAKRLVPGMDMTVTADGLEMILFQAGELWVTTRASAKAAFARPRKLAELQAGGMLTRPCLSGDGLVLYADELRRNQPPNQLPRLVKFTRDDRRARWRGPTPVPLTLPKGWGVGFFSVSHDGAHAFCTLFDDGSGRSSVGFLVARLRPEGGGFGRPQIIHIGGEPLRGKFARYVPATNELYYALEGGPDKPPEIRLVRNFDPDAIEAASAAASKPPRTDRELLQGSWVSVSEVNSGKPLTAEQLRDMNKRMDVRGDRMAIRRTGLGGKFGIFEGTFRLDPNAEPNAFDWTGKGPDGPFELHGIYELDGDTFRLCHGPGRRPTELRSTAGSGRQLIVYKREQK